MMGKFDEFMAQREKDKRDEMNFFRIKLKYIQIGLDDEKINQKALIAILKAMSMLNALSEDKT